MIRHLYVHIPFCAKICPYCNFYKSEATLGGFDVFVDALLSEARTWSGQVAPETIFFGGGTPTALNTRLLEKLILGLRSAFDWDALQEFTVEMNPSTVSPSKAKRLLELGVTRASMGVQSWEPRLLETLGRTHSASAARRSFDVLREQGFHNINIDHIFGVPGQTREEWVKTLETSLQLEPEHISAYSLTYEEDTAFFERLIKGEFRHNDLLDADLFEVTSRILTEAGFEAYETSNFCRSGFACSHNLAIWQGEDYLGLGPSAVSTLGAQRFTNIADTTGYVEAVARGTSFTTIESLDSDQIQLERLALGLRTTAGVPTEFADRVSCQRLVSEGFLTTKNGKIFLTALGRPLADELVLALVDGQACRQQTPCLL